MNGRIYILFLSFLSLVTMQAIGIGYWRCDSTHCGVGNGTLAIHCCFIWIRVAAAFEALSALVVDSHR
jgi:hypothetical protein